MSYSVAELAKALETSCLGDQTLRISRLSEPKSAQQGDLALGFDPRYADDLKVSKARVALLWQGADWQALGFDAAIIAPRGRLAMAKISALFDPGHSLAPGIHPSCVIGEGAQIAPDAAIGPFVVIGAHVCIGSGARIHSHVSIGDNSVIGDNILLHTGARISARIHIGHNVIIHSGAVIGADGFAFVTPQKSGIEEIRETLGVRTDFTPQSWVRIHSLGSVEIKDDVEIGANTCIDRGTIRNTVIGARTKIDNLVQIGHNAVLGEDCLLCAGVGIAGSTHIGNRVVMAGQSATSDNITIADDVIVGGRGAVSSSVRHAGAVLFGEPAINMVERIKIIKAMRRLPRHSERLAKIEAALKGLDKA